MIQITGLTNSTRQRFSMEVGNGKSVEFALRFMPTQLSWYFDFTYDDELYSGHKLVLGQNILRCYKSQVDFGLMVTSTDKVEPFNEEDFSNERVILYLLDQDEVTQIEQEVYLE